VLVGDGPKWCYLAVKTLSNKSAFINRSNVEAWG
jgi:hypothetical protein